MKGDFSKWYLDRKNNFSGVLHQQGRVLLDSDWNDQTRINNDWQDQAGQDVVGPGIAAVPVSEKDSFEVTEASVVYKEGSTVDYQVKLKVTPGRLWADGLLVTLPGEISVDRFAAYLNSPDKKPPAENLRDLVVLEVWKDSINGFQLPNLLIESALGGPDTTERVHTEMAFRLLRLKDGDTCQNIADKLTDSPEKKGKLTVSLKPGSSISTESGCPKVEGGGYTGLEHNLYRIEIADVKDTSEPMFKWSQFNGGLVGRGTFKSSNKSDETESESDEIEIKGNL
jgi:hypothetical protein